MLLRMLFEIRRPLVRELILEFFSTYRFADNVLHLDVAGTLLHCHQRADEEALSPFDCFHHSWESICLGMLREVSRGKMSGTIDMDELIRLRIWERLMGIPTWVAIRPERQQDE
nr:hypothetical protein [Tanacetum cinerariifolium]